MILKSYLVENNLSSIGHYNAVVFYGENEGLKEDFKNKIKILHKDTEIITFFQEDILNDKDILFNNIVNKSLFNLKKIIIINEVSDKIFSCLEEILDKIKLSPSAVLRKNEKEWKEIPSNKTMSEDQILEAMISKPKLIERPIVVSKNDGVLARPIENLIEYLKKY